MISTPRISFLVRFAIQDLADARGRASTFIIVLTVALVTVFTLLSLILPQAAERARLEHLKSEPLTLCLWAWDADGVAGQPITQQRLKELSNQLSHFVGESKQAHCYPFYELKLDWRKNTRDGVYSCVSLRGRTLQEGDPLLESCPLRGGEHFTLTDQKGVLVTPSLLNALDYPADPPPGTVLSIRAAASAELLKVPLLGVLREELPFRHTFVMTEAFENSLRTSEADVPLRTIRTGPVPSRWPRPFALPVSVREALAAFKISRPSVLERTGRPLTWSLTTERDTPPVRSLWRDELRRLNDLMQEAGYPRGRDFEMLETLEQQLPPPSRPGYDLVGVYVADLPALHPAAHAIRTVGLQANEGVIRQLQAYNEATQAARIILLWIAGIVGFIATVNLLALQMLRLQKKVAEIGMLGTIGMSSSTLLAIHGVEILLLWITGTLAGIVLSLATAEGLANACHFHPWKSLLSADFFSRGSVFLLLSLSFCVMSSWISILWTAHGTSPAMALSRQG